MKLVDVKLSLKSLRNVVEYEEALKSALASSASGTYGGMLVDVYVGVVSGSSPEAVKLGYEHVRRKLRGPSSAHVMALFATEDSDEEESSSDEEVGLPSRDDLLAHLNVVQGCVALIARVAVLVPRPERTAVARAVQSRRSKMPRQLRAGVAGGASGLPSMPGAAPLLPPLDAPSVGKILGAEAEGPARPRQSPLAAPRARSCRARSRLSDWLLRKRITCFEASVFPAPDSPQLQHLLTIRPAFNTQRQYM